jgi:hypothetical protein
MAAWALPHERYHSCALCGDAAMVWAALAALEHQGFKQPVWSHGGLKQTLTHALLQRRHLDPSVFGTWLGDAYDLRTLAHETMKSVGVKETRRRLHHTRECMATGEEGVASCAGGVSQHHGRGAAWSG